MLDNAAKALQRAMNNGSTKVCLFNETPGDTITEEDKANQDGPEAKEKTE